MKKLTLLAMPFMAISLLASCGGDKPTQYTLTLNLNDCKADGSSTYSKTYDKGATIEPITVSPNTDFVLTNDSVETGYQQYWAASTGGNYTFSNLKMDSDYTIAITATKLTQYTLTLNLNNCTVGGESTYSKTYNAGTIIDNVSVTPNTGHILTENSVSSTYQQYWHKLTEETYVLSKLKMNKNYTIDITAVKPSTPWYLDNNYINNLDVDDIGTTQTLKVNGIDHTVRLIGVDHDELDSDPTMNAHTTWEFVNFISDSEGYSLATPWNWREGASSTNYDYSNSHLRKALDGAGGAELVWYQKGSSTQSTTYTKSVFEMLPEDLQGAIKAVKKQVTSGPDHQLATCVTKVFPLSYREMTGSINLNAENEGLTYSFYAGRGNTDGNRIKHQIKWHEGAVTVATPITEGYSGASNYAGYNDNSREERGGLLWLRSPNLNSQNDVFNVEPGGYFSNSGNVYKNAYAVAPAFCLGEKKKWYLDNSYINNLDEYDVGTMQILKVNGIDHKIRLIGVNHDDLVDGSGKAHTTWEFANLLSDNDGYSLATVWDWRYGGGSTNHSFSSSNLRKALDGGGEADRPYWYQKRSSRESTTFKNVTVLDMLPADLRGVLKAVNKPIASGESYEVKSMTVNIFPLSFREMTTEPMSGVRDEGSTYAFYKGSGDTDTNRIKHQVRWHDGAATAYTTIVDGKYNPAMGYAGYNDSKQEWGGFSWLRSPCTNDNVLYRAVGIHSSGVISSSAIVYMCARSIAPAFCI